ncbi:MAG: phenylalanine--tRNA ligase subunit alpha [Candidatus Brennerbacteria bacterium]|nr:phenylalanine--tRNA ligase subunit alpha [Candidatus Brennerbacteria bacterium]
MDILKNLEEIKKLAHQDIEAIKTTEEFEKVRVKYLGRKSELSLALRSIKDLPIEERREVGFKAQKLKRALEELFLRKLSELNVKGQMSMVSLDITKPGKKIELGHLHPLTKISQEIKNIFISLNFSVVDGPQVEIERYNFDALNIPANHSARDMWDTFWLQSSQKVSSSQLSAASSRLLLRTHTSPVQIRYMESHQPPFQIIAPGTVYRYEATDATHSFQFQQLEGLMVGKNISFANFKYVISVFLEKFFKRKIEFILRPNYYPFVEPGVDVYIKWKNRWLEVAGAGMVHPKVFEAAHYNPREWQGFAFGFGLDRLAMIKYNIPDVRLFYSGDLRFIKQF